MHGYIAKIFGNNIFKMTISTKNIFCYDYQHALTNNQQNEIS
jgi:hypothetical protein